MEFANKPFRWGILERVFDQQMFKFTQNEVEYIANIAIIFELVPVTNDIPILNCIALDIPINSKIVHGTGIVDISRGFIIHKETFSTH